MPRLKTPLRLLMRLRSSLMRSRRTLMITRRKSKNRRRKWKMETKKRMLPKMNPIQSRRRKILKLLNLRFLLPLLRFQLLKRNKRLLNKNRKN